MKVRKTLEEERFFDERDFENDHQVYYTPLDEEDDLDYKQRPELYFNGIRINGD